MKILEPYTFSEASNYGDGFPDRGIKCYKCRTFIPQFDLMTSEKINKWKDLLITKSDESADLYLISITGCNSRWAKIWRLHPNGPNAKSEIEASYAKDSECPFCNKPLRTKKSKQCPHCLKSWHEKSA